MAECTTVNKLGISLLVLRNLRVIPYLRFVLEVDCVSISLLENSGMKIVLVLNVKIPATDISIGHVVSAKLGRLYVNNIFFAAGIFVANFYGRGGNTVNSLKKK